MRCQLLSTNGVEPSIADIETQLALENETIPVESELKPRKDVKIVAIDLQPMSPLQGIICLRADITHPATVPLLLHALDPSADPNSHHASQPVDLVISDGAPDVTGLHDLDIYVQSQLLFAALNLALCVLRPGGNFVAKIFRGRNVDLLFAQLKIFFSRVVVAKPRSSRASSVEAFIVCLNFTPPDGFQASLSEPMGVGDRLEKMVLAHNSQIPICAPTTLQDFSSGTWSTLPTCAQSINSDGVVELTLPSSEEEDEASGISRRGLEQNSTSHTSGGGSGIGWIAPFLACGDLSAFDADASYHLPANRISLDPVQPPTAPPYKRALEMRKLAGGAYGKTSVK